MTDNPYRTDPSLAWSHRLREDVWDEGYEAGRASRDAEVEAMRAVRDGAVIAIDGLRAQLAEKEAALRNEKRQVLKAFLRNPHWLTTKWVGERLQRLDKEEERAAASKGDSDA